jgi:hypothetical protein
MTLVPTPAADLDKVYRAVNHYYNKREANCRRTVDALDPERFYLEVVQDL